MGLPNHKRGCKCVGCSPATRKRGMAALKEHQAQQANGREKPAKKGRSNPSAEERGRKIGETTRKVAQAAGAVGRGVKAATKAAVCGAGRENGNRRPGIAGPAAAAGQYIVLRRQKGRVTSYEVCRTLREAEAVARRSLGATIARVESNWE